MSTTHASSDRLTALTHLGLTHCLPDGRWAYHADETGSWWVVDVADLEQLGRDLREGVPDAYSLWGADTGGDEVHLPTDATAADISVYLRLTHVDDHVRDAEGGAWHPSEEAREALDGCPSGDWLCMCVMEPCRGKWQD